MFQSRSKEEREEKRFEQNSHSESVVIHCPFLTWSSLLGLLSRFGSSSGLCRRTESLDGFFTTIRSFREVDGSESGECTDEALVQLPPSHLKLISLDVELESSVSAFSRRRRSRAIRYDYLPSFASSFGGLGGGSPPEQLLHPRDPLCPLTPLLVLVGAVAAVGAGRHGVTDRQDFTAYVNRLRLVSHSRLAALLLLSLEQQASEMLQPQRAVEAGPAVLSPQYERERRVIFSLHPRRPHQISLRCRPPNLSASLGSEH
ncbi:hypothetical protein GW17_00042001 [Ensete ventricosum]|nr:hypothetical protein GW17_00042001 [Ensete ventricosum]